jgi:hypothetical protein
LRRVWGDWKSVLMIVTDKVAEEATKPGTPFVFYAERRMVGLTGRKARNLGELLRHLREVSGSSARMCAPEQKSSMDQRLCLPYSCPDSPACCTRHGNGWCCRTGSATGR